MNNELVIKNFLAGLKAQTGLRTIYNGVYGYKGRTLSTDGQKLINYNTTIAYTEGNNIYLNVKKYSVTTSKIQSKLRQLVNDMYREEEIFEYEGE